MSPGDDPRDRDSVDQVLRVEELCDRYEDELRAGRRRLVDEFLRAAGIEPANAPPNLVRELAKLEAEYLGRRPDQTSAVEQNPAGTGSAPSGTAPDLGVPSVPGFEVLGELGHGAMGVVYRARQAGLNRDVALKMLIAGPYAAPAHRARFLIEAEAVAALEHPNVVKVFAVGEHGARPYLAMEYLTGGTLADRLKASGPLPGLAAAALLAKLAAAVGHAHSRGVVHRDIKPHNVLFGADGEPRLADFGLAKVGRSDLTVTGQILGTPAYMAPEQAAGKVNEVGTAADVYALGAVLYDLLTGRPPFRGNSHAVTLQKVLTEEPSRPRALVPAVPRDLETVCLKCLEKAPAKRYQTAQALADDLARYLRGEPVEARPTGSLERAYKWVRRNPGRAAAVAVAVLLVVGGIVTAFQVQRAFAAQQFAAEKKRQEEQRRTRAESLVQALSTADTTEVPRIVADLADLRDLAGPKLVELVGQPVATKPGLHARLALVADEPQRVAELAAYLLVCKSEELLTIRDALKPHAPTVSPGLWAVLLDPKGDAEKRVRAACALAGLTPDDDRWAAVAEDVAGLVVKENPLRVVVWSRALEPVRAPLLPALMKRYPDSREKIGSGKLAVAELAAEATAFDLTADLLARYSADRPELAELALTVDARHYPLFAEAIRANRVTVIPVLKAELARNPGPTWAVDGGGSALAAVIGGATALEALDPDPVLAERAKRKGHAAAVLVALGEGESVWPLFRFPSDGDPTARSFLLARLAAVRADPVSLVRRFDIEADVSAKRALLLALGDFPPELVPEQEAFVGRLLVLYREHPDSGLHSAIDWLLRQKWGKANEVAAIDAELAAASRAQVVARGLMAVGRVPVGPLLPAPVVAAGKDWYVNGEGQTFAVVRGPVEFTLGSPVTEPVRYAPNEPAHRKRIGRTFAIATREVTNEQFLRFRPGHIWLKPYSPGPNTPAVEMNWYTATAYCNWLSALEGIPVDQWCYEPNKDGLYAEGMRVKAGHLGLTGYRLPTEAEWEFACRGGAVTARYYGRGVELVPRYAWSELSTDHARPVGLLRPNERGVFDGLGNAAEWTVSPALHYATSRREDGEDRNNNILDEHMLRILRGGGHGFHSANLRCALRAFDPPGALRASYGFRPVRTLP